jgi:pilus assembly protein Flp/PilA
MVEMRRTLGMLWQDRRGVTALEYALIALLIGVAIISGVTMLGSNLKVMFSNVATSV